MLKQGNHEGAKSARQTHNGSAHTAVDGELFDLSQVRSIDGLVRAMSMTVSTGRQAGEAADVLETMARDEECFVVMTLSGASTLAQHGLIVSELIDCGILNALVSTGALPANGFADETSQEPALEPPSAQGDGFGGPQASTREGIVSQILDDWDHNEVMSSYKLNHVIGSHFAKQSAARRGILKSAYEHGVPVFVPAFTASDLGLEVALNNRMRESTGRHKIRFDPFEDLEHFAATLLRQKRLGILSVGGGVVRNWSHRFVPFIESRHRRLGENVPLKHYDYDVRIGSRADHTAGSSENSGASFPVPGGVVCEVGLDPVVGLPLIVAAVLERLDNHRKGGAAKGKKEKAAK